MLRSYISIIQLCFVYLIDWFDKYNEVSIWAHSIKKQPISFKDYINV